MQTIAFACGDEKRPSPDTIFLLRVFLDEFLQSVSSRAHKKSKFAGSPKLRLRELLACLQNSEAQYLRAASILDFLAKYR